MTPSLPSCSAPGSPASSAAPLSSFPSPSSLSSSIAAVTSKPIMPHWGSYHSPPTILSRTQCRFLRHKLLPSLPPGRTYAFVYKSHSQLLLLGNNVVLVYRAGPATAATLESTPRGVGARSASADCERDGLQEEERASKKVKL
jgi:hypothetical protein